MEAVQNFSPEILQAKGGTKVISRQELRLITTLNHLKELGADVYLTIVMLANLYQGKIMTDGFENCTEMQPIIYNLICTVNNDLYYNLLKRSKVGWSKMMLT